MTNPLQFLIWLLILLSRSDGKNIHRLRHTSPSFRERRQINDGQHSIDFRSAYDDPDTGLKCVNKEGKIQVKERERLLECVHSNVNVCHYTYITRFTSQRVEECTDNYEKICSIVFKNLARNETIKHCYRPMVKECSDEKSPDGDDNLICKTVFESECSTRYVEKESERSEHKKFIGLTACKKLPVELCASQYCRFVPGEEECHNKTLTSLVSVPEESCDLVPQETCKGVYKLVPYLVPESQCKDIPREVCSYGIKSTRLGEKPLITKWCYDPSEGTDPSSIIRTGGAKLGSNAVLNSFLDEEERRGLANGRRPLKEIIPEETFEAHELPKNEEASIKVRPEPKLNEGRRANVNGNVDDRVNFFLSQKRTESTRPPLNLRNRSVVNEESQTKDPFREVFTILSGSEENNDSTKERVFPSVTQEPVDFEIPTFLQDDDEKENGRKTLIFGNKEINTPSNVNSINTEEGEFTTGPAPIPSEVEYFDQYEDFDNPSPTLESRKTAQNELDDETTPATTPRPIIPSNEPVIGTASADIQSDLDLKVEVDEASLKLFDDFLQQYEANYDILHSDENIDFTDYDVNDSIGFNSDRVLQNNVAVNIDDGLSSAADSSTAAVKGIFPRSTTPQQFSATTPPSAKESRLNENEKRVESFISPAPSVSPNIQPREPKRSENLVFHNEIPENFEPLLDVLNPEEHNNIKIAKVVSPVDHTRASKEALARVIKHKDSKSQVGQTIIIRNTPEAIKLFGIKNIPRNVLLSNQERSNYQIVSKIETTTRTTTTTAKSTIPEPSSFSDIFLSKTTTPSPKNELQLNVSNDPKTFSSLLGIQKTEFTVEDRRDLKVKDLPFIHFTTLVPQVEPKSTTTERNKSFFTSIGQLLSFSGNSTTENPFTTRKTTVSISRGTPSWRRTTTGAKIRLKSPEQILNNTGANTDGTRSSKTLTFVRKPSITAIQDFAAPDKPNTPKIDAEEEVTRQILNLGFQNTVRKHNSIIQPGKSPQKRPQTNFENNFVRTSRNPPQNSGFSPPSTLLYGFKPMTTPLVDEFRAFSTPAPLRSFGELGPRFSPPSNLHFGFRPMNDERRVPHQNFHQGKRVVFHQQSSLNHNNRGKFRGSFNDNNQVKRNVPHNPKAFQSQSVFTKITDILTSPFKSFIKTFK